ncbi:hypothetical protein ACKLNQ_12475 [Myroides odoratimimus]|uniref:hypothetical protein n=1 Tax=Myroides odoratimimus TaxID=76832 RepID=UPI0038D4A073
MEDSIKVIIESYQRGAKDRKYYLFNTVYLDFVDVKSYYLFLKSLSEAFGIENQKVFGMIECDKILKWNIADEDFNGKFFSSEVNWYSGFEIKYRYKYPFRFSHGEYILNTKKVIEMIREGLSNESFQPSGDESYIKWFTLDIQGLDIAEVLIKQ